MTDSGRIRFFLLLAPLLWSDTVFAIERGPKVDATDIENVRLKKRANKQRYYNEGLFGSSLFSSSGWSYVKNNPFIYYKGSKLYTGFVVGRNELDIYDSSLRFAGHLKNGVRDGVWKFWNADSGYDTTYILYLAGTKSSEKLGEMERRPEYYQRVKYKYIYRSSAADRDTQITYSAIVT